MLNRILKLFFPNIFPDHSSCHRSSGHQPRSRSFQREAADRLLPEVHAVQDHRQGAGSLRSQRLNKSINDQKVIFNFFCQELNLRKTTDNVAQPI